MAVTHIQLIVAAFENEELAQIAFQELKLAQKQHLLKIQDAAVIWRDLDNQLHIKETSDPGGGQGAIAGSIFGAIIGLIAGPAGFVIGAAAGALVGGVTAKIIDSGIPDDRLKQIGEGVKPGSSAIIGIFEQQWADVVKRLLQKAGAEVLTEQMSIEAKSS